MTKKDRIELATKEVKEAEIILKIRIREVKEWEDKLDLRRETLERLKKN